MTTARRTQTIAAVLSICVLVGYAFVAITFTIPAAPARAAVSDAFGPYFSQRWNVFAPHIVKTNRELEIQVQWREDGELVHSDWVNVTDIEYGAVRGHPMPSRVSKSSWNAMQAYTTRYNALTEGQRERARDTFIESQGVGEFGAIPVDELIDLLDEDGGSRQAVVRFLRYDYMLMRFATAFGAAYFDRDADEIERVRWRIVTERPNDFLHRFDEEPQTPPTVRTFGWRQSTAEIDAETAAVFGDVIDRYTGR